MIMNTGLPTGDGPPSPAFLAWRAFAATQKDMDIGRIIQRGSKTELAPKVVAAYDAPFPDASYKAGADQFPLLVPVTRDSPAVPAMLRARKRSSLGRSRRS